MTGLGAGFVKTNKAAGVRKVHILCAGDGFPLMESKNEMGDPTCEVGYEHGMAMKCLW